MPGLSQKHCPSFASQTCAYLSLEPIQSWQAGNIPKWEQQQLLEKASSVMFTESFISSFCEASKPLSIDRAVLARLGNQCGLSSLPQDSLFFTIGATPFPIDTLCPSLHLSSTNRQLYVLSIQKAGRWVWVIVPWRIRTSVTIVDKMQFIFPRLLSKSYVPTSLPLFMQLPGILFIPISINL